MNATATSNYIGEAIKTATALAPPSLADKPALLAWVLFVMTAAMLPGADDSGQAGAANLGCEVDRSPD